MNSLFLFFLRRHVVLSVAVLILTTATAALAQEAQLIWSPEHQKGSVPLGACHFRKQIVYVKRIGTHKEYDKWDL